MSKIKTVVFDADGTLFDTAEVIYNSYVDLAERKNLPPPTREQVMEAIRTSTTIRQILLKLFPEADSEELFLIVSEYVGENASQILIYEGLVELLDRLVEQKLKLAILTGAGPRIQSYLDQHRVSEHFTSVVHSERVSKHKPDPEGFMLAMEECGSEPAESVMVGDTVNDIEVAKRAGAAFSVGITHGFGTREDLQKAGADYIIDSLAELPALLEKVVTDED